MAAPTISTMIDPTKQAEYPIVLGERLAKEEATGRLINVNYNYKTKSSTPTQRSTITRSSLSRDLYDLSVTDKPPGADHNLTYAYQGSEDPVDERSLVLVFDPDRKVFVLESVATKLNFNLRSRPGKSEKEVRHENLELLPVYHEDDHTSSDDRNATNTSEDEGPADESNPYDFRHFLQKGVENQPTFTSGATTPEPVSTSKATTPVIHASKPAPAPGPVPKPMPRPKKQSNPLRAPKRPAKPQASSKPPRSTPEPPAAPTPRVDPPEDDVRSSLSDAGTGSASQQTVQSPNSNIIVDGDLIIDMGSPPPTRAFKVNPAYFSSNNTPDDRDDDEEEEEEEEEMDSFRLPSPAKDTKPPPAENAAESAGGQVGMGEDDDYDPLAAEMEAAFEESAREEQVEPRQYTQTSTSARYNVPSDDESEVSEEE
ncbi:hypothetical protein N7532_004542 [Penicillium argentinense]|uniref:Transcription elongation factor Eaf N-terminal domain-containing protein n=1 Tax=Penicillium argentinense TaxID=1131581 RepID=A0A9W9FPN5_9EURO|nr:uncharacterized protein N7532_004542 [Penicillium argentinense]KAJ5104013.1 hypothetical protein N7532_004542 [Penicillium argentinense]